jgi:hypothetical protein
MNRESSEYLAFGDRGWQPPSCGSDRGSQGGDEGARAYPDRVRYHQEARSPWRTSVPRSGQAAAVQGELLRAVENLRDEA